MNYDDDEKSIFFLHQMRTISSSFIQSLCLPKTHMRRQNERHSLSSRRVVNEIHNELISVHFLWHYG